jgi:type II secretory ATPase GspE/PulE/Tfp pilus assembly ATPase PilB-like protein
MLVRKLGRWPRSDEPWLPITTLGPLLVFAHHDPKSDEMWGVADHLTVKVAISSEQYEHVRREIVARVSANPLPKENPLENLPAPEVEPGDICAAFDWLIDNYPFEATEKERLVRSYKDAIKRADEFDIAKFNSFQPHLGVAVAALASPKPLLCFNPEDAPRQEEFPNMLLEKHGVFPVYAGKHRVYLLSENENDYAFEDEWMSSGNDPIEFVSVLADGKAIRKAIGRSNDLGLVETTQISEDDMSYSDNQNLVEIIPEDVYAIDPKNVNHTPEEIIHWVLYNAVTAGASDVHLEKFYNTLRFRARIDGHLKTIYTGSEELLPRYIALVKNYANMSQNRKDSQDGRFAMSIGQRRVDVRSAAIPCRKEQQKLILRFLDKQDGMKELAELNLSQRQSEIISEGMGRDQGLVLVTGPTGSGKTTTLYALLHSINEEHINIHTIEYPIEYEIEGLNQTQTDVVHGIDFLSGLRALLRSDPDVILIGECRDEETATAAVNAALTGHLVLTTLHANDCLRAISRLLSMGVPAFLLCDSLALTQAQRLVRRLCGYCKRAAEPSKPMLELLVKHKVVEASSTQPIYEKVGCEECSMTGYKGRLALMEMTSVSSEMRDLIEEGAPQSKLRQVAAKDGMLSLYQEGLRNIVEGNTTLEEIRGLSYTAG